MAVLNRKQIKNYSKSIRKVPANSYRVEQGGPRNPRNGASGEYRKEK